MPVAFMASVWTPSRNNAVRTLIDPTPKVTTVLDAAAAISITIAATGDNGATFTKFLTNSPLGMYCTDVVTEDGKSSVVCSWTPTSHQDGQVFNFCFTAVDDSQMESERRCLKLSAGSTVPLTVEAVDECLTNDHTCDENAVCTDTDESYSCECVVGYVGDGFTCTGKYMINT